MTNLKKEITEKGIHYIPLCRPSVANRLCQPSSLFHLCWRWKAFLCGNTGICANLEGVRD